MKKLQFRNTFEEQGDEIERQNGGCNYQYYTYDEQAQMKSNNIFQEIKSVVKYDFKFEEVVKSVDACEFMILTGVMLWCYV